MNEANTAVLDIYVQRELGDKLRKTLGDAEPSGLSALLRSLLDELQDATTDDMDKLTR